MIVTLLLAAGASRRFGADKLLVPLPDGTPLVAAAARNLTQAGCQVLAVVRPESEMTATLLGAMPGVFVTACPESYLGIGRSIAWGVAESGQPNGWLIALGDMPEVSQATVRALVQSLEQGASIVAPVYSGRRGHPVGFGGEWRADLLALQGDRGGASIIDANQRHLKLITCTDSGVVRDVDRPSDLSG